MTGVLRFALALLALAALARPAAAAADGALCEAAITAVEKSVALPPLLLRAIGLVESGRADPRTSRVTPWPWSINIAGQDRVFETKAAAIAAVQAAQAAGTQSIDVGCMQVNLMYHPAAFATLDAAFDPRANVVYAAGFLGLLYAQTGDWRRAAAAYHSQTPALSEPYAQRVIASWPLAGRYGYRAGPVPAALDDPGAGHAYTPEFRSYLARAAADRARWAAMGLVPARPGRAGRPVSSAQIAALRPAPLKMAPLKISPVKTAALHETAPRLAASSRGG